MTHDLPEVRAMVTFYPRHNSKLANERTGEAFFSLRNAHAIAMRLHAEGCHPRLEGEGWKAFPVRDGPSWRGDDRPLQWGLSIDGVGCWKSAAHFVAEEAGVKYASHRKGYRASQRAFAKFLRLWCERCDRLMIEAIAA